MKTQGTKTIIIIGASGGIGSVMARVFRSLGWNVALASRTAEKLVALQKTLGEEGTLVAPTDASDAQSVQNLFASTAKKWGRVDAVVITAGSWKRLSAKDSIEDALKLIDAHYQGLFLPSFVAGFVAQKFFQEQGGGLIVNISSHAAVKPELPGNLSYGPMKAASRHFMLGLRHEPASANVRVTDIEPAIVDTPDNKAFFETEEQRQKAVKPETIANWVAEHIDDLDIPPAILFESATQVK